MWLDTLDSRQLEICKGQIIYIVASCMDLGQISDAIIRNTVTVVPHLFAVYLEVGSR